MRARLPAAETPVPFPFSGSPDVHATNRQMGTGLTSPLRVMHVLDTLAAGGQERFAVYLANLVPRSRYQTHVCTTRSDGVLADLVARDVGRLRLGRTRQFDIQAVFRMAAYVRDQRIDILHAHAAAVFLAALASVLPPYPRVVWHLQRDKPPKWPYWLLARRVRAVIATTESLATWSVEKLGIPAGRVRCIANFSSPAEGGDEGAALPGSAGARIVCVANLRPEKDHLTLVRAMDVVVRQHANAHLLIVGPRSDAVYFDHIQREIAARGLTQHITLLGQRHDISAILRSCDIGVLTSIHEGLPLALIEYGLAGLPAIATDVGACADVLDHGRVGVVVPPVEPEEVAAALVSLLRSPARRAELGKAFRRRVETTYGPDRIVRQVCSVYEMVIT